MRTKYLWIGVLLYLEGAYAIPSVQYITLLRPTTSSDYAPSTITDFSSIYTPRPTGGGDCGDDCGGTCGDGIVQYPYEECDLGPRLNGAPQSGCSKDCIKVPFCGDGIVDWAIGETCDLGSLNGVPGSGCSSNCTCVPECGNGKIEPGEECDAGSANGDYNSGCSENCKLCGYCGDGIIDDAAGEQCDDGWQYNGTPGNPCSANCTKTTTTYCCGNGILEPGEECDHGSENGLPGNSCSSNCTWVTCGCGNGITEYPEQCDDGELNGSEYSRCSKNCTWIDNCGNPKWPICGNGVVEYPEECDDGWLNGSPYNNCTTVCTICTENHHECGDGHVDQDEECDDGLKNGTPESNCDIYCQKKPSTCPDVSCNPNPLFNKCTLTTSCISTPLGYDYCACRAGYRADGLEPADPKQFRLSFPGQEYRVFVAPGVDCDTLCDTSSCAEVPVDEY